MTNANLIEAHRSISRTIAEIVSSVHCVVPRAVNEKRAAIEAEMELRGMTVPNWRIEELY